MSDNARLIESDHFPFEFLSTLAERESWRKEIHRPIYHVHKWWAKRLGSVFRGILLGCHLHSADDLAHEFYKTHSVLDRVILDPFMGSGTTIGEAHKLGMTALGRDINPVAVRSVRTGLGQLDQRKLTAEFAALESRVGEQMRQLYESVDRRGKPCDVLYYFWVMQADCPECKKGVDLFPNYVFAKNARPTVKPEVQCYCPKCGDVFESLYGKDSVACESCDHVFNPTVGAARGTRACCNHCSADFRILDVMAEKQGRPRYRMYAKLVLRRDSEKEYLRVTKDDLKRYDRCQEQLNRSISDGDFTLPDLRLENGHNTKQAMGYGFLSWRDFFNDRQLLALAWLRESINQIQDTGTRAAFLTLFSGVLEFNNLFASYKGEGTGAVRHMFSHHILKPERTPIEANVWGTPKSSGSFSGLFPMRLLRAAKYQQFPTEVNGRSGDPKMCSLPISGRIEPEWPIEQPLRTRSIYLSCGDSSDSALPDGCVDWVVTDPPFFDNVHYSELADFFHAWRQDGDCCSAGKLHSTRAPSEVQDKDARKFAAKLRDVFRECHRVLKVDGLLVFSYHHSRSEGWGSLASAILGSGFFVANAHPIKSEMSVATPKSQAKEPIQFDIILVCKKHDECNPAPKCDRSGALSAAKRKAERLVSSGFQLSQNDWRIIQYGQLLSVLRDTDEIHVFVDSLADIDVSVDSFSRTEPVVDAQKLLF
jgi:putative DNA methylase